MEKRSLGIIGTVAGVATIGILLLIHGWMTPALRDAAVGSGAVSEEASERLTVPDMMIGADFDAYRTAFDVLTSPGVMRWYGRIRTVDWVFPAIYGLCLVALLWPVRRWAVLFPVAAVFFDYLENIVLGAVRRSGSLSLEAYRVLQVIGVLKFVGVGISVAIVLAAYLYRLRRRPV